jgi:hypothetical protein
MKTKIVGTSLEDVEEEDGDLVQVELQLNQSELLSLISELANLARDPIFDGLRLRIDEMGLEVRKDGDKVWELDGKGKIEIVIEG